MPFVFFHKQRSVLSALFFLIVFLLVILLPALVFILSPSVVINHVQTFWFTKRSNSTANTKPTNMTESLLHPSAISTSSCNMPQPPSFPLKPPQEQNISQVLLDYIHFHKTARECLLNPDCKQKPKILVATCPREKRCLGLGDRMRGIVFSFITAVITKRLYFIHNMSTPYSLQAGSAPSAIDWTLPPNILFNDSWPYLEWYWCRRSVCNWKNPALTNLPNFNDQGPDINMMEDDVLKVFGERPVVQLACRLAFHNGNSMFLRQNPHLNNTYAELARIITERRVNIHRLLFQPSETTRQMMKTLEFSGDYYSVHIRNGKDAGETGHARFKYLAAHEGEAVDQILQCVGILSEESNITNVFLASDSPSTKEIFLRKGKEKGYDVHALDKQTLHYGRQKPWQLGSITWDSMCESFVSVHADLFMMAEGKAMIKTGSNFATLAGYLAGNIQTILHNKGNVSVESWCRPRQTR